MQFWIKVRLQLTGGATHLWERCITTDNGYYNASVFASQILKKKYYIHFLKNFI